MRYVVINSGVKPTILCFSSISNLSFNVCYILNKMYLLKIDQAQRKTENFCGYEETSLALVSLLLVFNFLRICKHHSFHTTSNIQIILLMMTVVNF
jgi:hypothetical protein